MSKRWIEKGFVLTAAAVGLLLEQGRLALDEIQTHVPAFPRRRWKH